MKDTLSSFLPQLPGVIDTPGAQDNSSLRGLIDKPPGKTNFKEVRDALLIYPALLQFVAKS